MFKWRSYVVFESCDRAVHKPTINMWMIETCFYCLFTHKRNQPKYNMRWQVRALCHLCTLQRRVGTLQTCHQIGLCNWNFVKFRRFFHVLDRHGLALVTMATQKAARTIFYFLHLHIETILYQWENRSNPDQFIRPNYAGIYANFMVAKAV